MCCGIFVLNYCGIMAEGGEIYSSEDEGDWLFITQEPRKHNNDDGSNMRIVGNADNYSDISDFEMGEEMNFGDSSKVKLDVNQK